MNFREFVESLEKSKDIVKISRPVSLKYEAAAIMKKLDGKAVLFEKIKESDYPVVANICSSRELVAKALGCEKDEIIKKMAKAIENPKLAKTGTIDYKKIDTDLKKLPILIHYPEDGGPYISSAIVVANDKELGINSSFHRMMIIGKDKMVIRILQRHLNDYIKRGNKEIAICISPGVQVLVASAVSCELGKNELDIANALVPTKFSEIEGHLVPDSEIVMIAEIIDEMHDEGKFIDLTGTYDIIRKQSIVKVKSIYTKKNPYYHALLPGGFEHKTLMGMPREPSIFREVNKICKCKDVFLSTGGCSWLHGIVQISKKNDSDGRNAIDAAFKGHSSMKHVVIVDDDIDIYNSESVEWAIATRVQADKDVIILPGQKGSSLDPSADSHTYITCKVGIDATIPSEKSKKDFMTNKIPGEDKVNLDDSIKKRKRNA